MGALRLLVALPAALRCLRLAVPRPHPLLRSCTFTGALPCRPGRWCAGVPPALPSWRHRALPGSWATRSASALLSDPDRAAVPRHFGTYGAAPAFVDYEGPSEHSPFEAQSHGFCGRCLRFALRVAPADARLASGCLLCFTGWDWLPTGWLRKVSDVYFIFLLPQAWPGATTNELITQGLSLIRNAMWNYGGVARAYRQAAGPRHQPAARVEERGGQLLRRQPPHAAAAHPAECRAAALSCSVGSVASAQSDHSSAGPSRRLRTARTRRHRAATGRTRSLPAAAAKLTRWRWSASRNRSERSMPGGGRPAGSRLCQLLAPEAQHRHTLRTIVIRRLAQRSESTCPTPKPGCQCRAAPRGN